MATPQQGVQQKSEQPKSDLLGKPPTKAELVTYLPKDGDPAKVRWAGKTFHANMGLMVDDPIVLAKARTSKWFHVGEGAPRVEVEETVEPKNQDQYRAHVAAWIRTVQTKSEFDARWQSEETLRINCGMGTSDLDLLNDFMRPYLAELEKRSRPGRSA